MTKTLSKSCSAQSLPRQQSDPPAWSVSRNGSKHKNNEVSDAESCERRTIVALRFQARDLLILYADRKLKTSELIACIETQFHSPPERTKVEDIELAGIRSSGYERDCATAGQGTLISEMAHV
jgi:hypothetical protein